MKTLNNNDLHYSSSNGEDNIMSDIQIKYIPVTQIILDKRNPRVAPALENLEGEPPETWIDMALGQYAPDDEEKGASTTFSSLKASIRSYRGLISPIVVTTQADGKYIVIEGNTRVSIYRQLAHEKAPGSWETIPAIVREEIEESGEHAIRLQAHLVGPRPWRPYAKAKYLHSLYTEEKLSINEILDYCGGTARKREIEDYISAYIDMQDNYMPILGKNQPDYSRFSAFAELQKPQIKQSIFRHGYSLEDFAKWVHESKINPTNTVRQLPRILAHPEAKKKFLSHNAREALKVLEVPNANAALKEATIEQLANALTNKIRNLNYSDLKEFQASIESTRVQALSDCCEDLLGLCKDIGITTVNE